MPDPKTTKKETEGEKLQRISPSGSETYRIGAAIKRGLPETATWDDIGKHEEGKHKGGGRKES